MSIGLDLQSTLEWERVNLTASTHPKHSIANYFAKKPRKLVWLSKNGTTIQNSDTFDVVDATVI